MTEADRVPSYHQPSENYETQDLGVAASFKALDIEPEVVLPPGSGLAVFRFVRSDRFEQVLQDLANGRIRANPKDLSEARAELRTRATLLRSARRAS